MTHLTPALKRARALLESHGWVGPQQEPFCLNQHGATVLAGDEGAHVLSVYAAIAAQGLDVAQVFDFLHRIANPSAAAFEAALAAGNNRAALVYVPLACCDFWSFESWLAAPYRGLGEVLRLFTEAITRSKKQDGRT